METHTIIKNGVEMEIQRVTCRYGESYVTARFNGNTARGMVAGIRTQVYPRIEFSYQTAQWLHDHADERGWLIDEYETDEEIEQRPMDSCTYYLTDEEVAFLMAWRVVPENPTVPKPSDGSNGRHGIMGIGGIGTYIENEAPSIPSVEALERMERAYANKIICKRCGASSVNGAMFTTLAGSNICDDCL